MTDRHTTPATSRENWRDRLTDSEYRVLRQRGTEPRNASDLIDVEGPGVFSCAGCGQELFEARTQFDADVGWPCFWAPIDETAVIERRDRNFGRGQTELLCSDCHGHLGHVFEDGPPPTGRRYCVNGTALEFEPDRQ